MPFLTISPVADNFRGKLTILAIIAKMVDMEDCHVISSVQK
jgi:hypothetical protein